MRQERIVKYLAAKTQVITAKALAEQFQISERTLANDIKLLKDLGDRTGFTIERIRNQGYQLHITNQKQFQNYLQENTQPGLSENDLPQKRVKNIGLLLLFQDDYVTLQQISDWLDVSISTVKNDMKQVEKFCEANSLTCYTKAHFGVKIIGNETDKRKAILALTHNRIDIPSLTEKYKEFAFIFEEAELRTFLKGQLQKYQLKINDVVFENVIQHIKLLAFRILQNNTLTQEEFYDRKFSPEYNELTAAISNYLAEKYQLKISESEKSYLKKQLWGKFTVLNNQQDHQQLFSVIVKALNALDSEYHTKFHEDQELANALLLHVAPLLQRLYSDHQLENPLIEDIYTQYANVFNIAFSFINFINKDLETTISKDEIGYVAVYFAASLEKQTTQDMNDYRKIAVICTTGGGASYLLKVNLERLFNHAAVTTFALNELSEIGQDFDLIISTVPFDDTIFDSPIIFTKNILTKTEITKIEQDLKLMREFQQKTLNLNQFLLSLFKEEWFQISEEKDYLALLEAEGEKLEAAGFAQSGYTKSLLERERLIDTIYQKGVAGPHPMKQLALKEVVSVILLKDGTVYNEKNVKIIFLINIKQGHLNLHKEISRLMIQLIEEPTLESELAKIRDFSDFLHYIKNLMKKG